jgi:glycerophosphoryl diester phosphodiesterase
MFSQLCLAVFLSQLSEATSPWPAPADLLLGHRGARAQAPENTIPSFEKAMKLGAHGIEFDVFLSKDKIPIIIHDDTLERTTNGFGVAWEKTAAELNALDAAKGWPDFVGTKLPTLAETLDAMPDGAVVNIEMKGEGLFTKEEFADAVFEVMAKNRERLFVIVSSFDALLLEIMRKKDANLFIGFLLDEHSVKYVSALKYLKAVKPNALHISANLAKPWIVRLAHRKGLKVLVWTVNDKTQAKQLRTDGVDGIFSDLPMQFLN